MISRLKGWLRGYATRKQALVLTYHSILKHPFPFAVWSHLNAAHFESQIAYLARNFRCVSLATLLEEMEGGDIEPYTISITFDDGFSNNASVAFPILQRYQVPTTIFLTTEYIGSNQLLWPEQISCALSLTDRPILEFADSSYSIATNEQKGLVYRQLTSLFKKMPPNKIPENTISLLDALEVSPQQMLSSAWGEALQAMRWCDAKGLKESGLIEFGAHTLTHSCLSALPNAEAEREINESKRVLEEHVGSIDYFAYPYGEGYYSREHREMAIRAGYNAILTTRPQTITPGTDRFAIPRVGIGADISMEKFSYMLHGGVARHLDRCHST